MAQLVDLLDGPSIGSSVDQQTSLVDLLGFAHLDRIPELAKRQFDVVTEFKRRAEEMTAKDLIQSMEEKKKDEVELPTLGKQVVVRMSQTMDRQKQERKKLKKAKMKGQLNLQILLAEILFDL